MVFLLYLTKKNKLGNFGRIWKKQIIKIAKSKIGLAGIFMTMYIIFFSSLFIYMSTINFNTENTLQVQKELAENNLDGFEDFTLEYIMTNVTLENFILMFQNPNFNTDTLGAIYAIMDKWSAGWLQHFNIIFLIEEIEALGFLIYFRWFYREVPKIVKT